jgi:hypothetical protein
VSRETKRLLEFEEKEDGEFWIGLKHFCKEFEAVCICTADFGNNNLYHVGISKLYFLHAGFLSEVPEESFIYNTFDVCPCCVSNCR